MTKVLCINDKNSIGGRSQYYIKGKWYQVVAGDPKVDFMFYIKSDNGTTPAVERKNFITVEEFRNNKLNEIGI